MADFYTVPDGKKSQEPSTYNVVRCETCSEILVYNMHDAYDEEMFDTKFGDLAFPRPSAFTSAVPERIRNTYKEAVLVKNLSPNAYAILARRVLEEICREQGVAAVNLAAALEELARRDVIPATLSEATTLIRLVGNAGAHASDKDVTMLQVWAIDDFIKAIVEYIYVAPKKIEEFKSRFEHFSERPIKRPEARSKRSPRGPADDSGQ